MHRGKASDAFLEKLLVHGVESIETSVHNKSIFIAMRAPIPAQCNMHQFKSSSNVMVCVNEHLELCVMINLTLKRSSLLSEMLEEHFYYNAGTNPGAMQHASI